MLAKLGGLTWLFTGDLEEEGEKFLVATYPELRADVLRLLIMEVIRHLQHLF